MWKNYFKIALRNLVRHKLYTFLNIAGLAIGISCATILYLYIQNEFSYNMHYPNAKNIYRVTIEMKWGDNYMQLGITQGVLAETLLRDYPEIKDASRIYVVGRDLIQYRDKKLYLENIAYADPNWFQLFEDKFIQGNAKTALQKPNSMVITKTTAQKIFGNVPTAMGKRLEIGEENFAVVRGIIEDLPHNTDIEMDVFISLKSIDPEKYNLNSWTSFNNSHTFLLLPPQTDSKHLERKLQKIPKKYILEDVEKFTEEDFYKYHLQPLQNMHLYSSHLIGENTPNNIQLMYTLSAIAVFILLLATINYMNLATARATQRAKEVGIRKVVGCYKTQLIIQFIGESILLVCLSVLLSLSLIELILPFFNHLVDRELSLIIYLQDPANWLRVFLFIGVLGIVSGSYPAFVLSAFRPVTVLKGKLIPNKKGTFLRKGLVIFQFTVSITMIINTWMVYRQLVYMKNTELGFNQQRLITFKIEDKKTAKHLPVIKHKLLQNPHIQQVALSNHEIGTNNNSSTTIEIMVKEQDENIQSQKVGVGVDYFKTIEARIVKGRDFNRQENHMQDSLMIVNETWAKRAKNLGWKRVVGQKVFQGKHTYRIIGIVQDFHLKSLHTKVKPAVFMAEHFNQVIVRLKTKKLKHTLKSIQKIYRKFDQKYPCEIQFVDQTFAKQYQEDEKLSTIFLIFSGIAIFVACLGLFGLATFTMEQRLKEIGIRKVLGATLVNILQLLFKDFVLLILAANIIAFPVAFLLISNWLQNFAYQTSINLSIFLFAGAIALLIAMLTIGVQAFRTMRVNPIEVLKDE